MLCGGSAPSARARPGRARGPRREGEIVYKINYDNAYHLKARVGKRGQVERDVVAEKYILGMRVLLLGMEQA